MTIDAQRVRRESMRWYILLALNNARPEDLAEEILLATMRAIYSDVSPLELRRKMSYLAERGLIEIRKEPSGRWWSHLTRHGVDMVEYTIDCEPGIARPQKYWSGSGV